MERLVHGIRVIGVEVGPRTECAHYGTPLDVAAIRFMCCGEYFPCIQCHQALADHESLIWPRHRFDEKAVLCGTCGYELTAAEYLACGNVCPSCQGSFNPGCQSHWRLYFDV